MQFELLLANPIWKGLLIGVFTLLPAAAHIRTVETPVAILRLDEHSGNLIGVTWKNPRLELIGEPRLGENFRILLPTPGYEAAYFCSRDQAVARIEVAKDGVTCFYDSLANDQEKLPVKVSVRHSRGRGPVAVLDRGG